METGYLFVVTAAPGPSGEPTFQSFVANTEETGEHWRSRFRDFRLRYGFKEPQMSFIWGSQGIEGSKRSLDGRNKHGE